MTLTASIRAAITAQLSKSLDLGSPAAQIQLSELISLVDGVDVGEVDKAWGDTRTLAASATETLDFGTAGTALTDALGDAFGLVGAEVVALMIKAAAGNTNDVIVGDAAAEPFLGPMGGTTPTTTIKPGGFVLWYNPAGWAVANNTNDKFKIANSAGGTGVDYSIIMLVRSS